MKSSTAVTIVEKCMLNIFFKIHLLMINGCRTDDKMEANMQYTSVFFEETLF